MFKKTEMCTLNTILDLVEALVLQGGRNTKIRVFTSFLPKVFAVNNLPYYCKFPTNEQKCICVCKDVLKGFTKRVLISIVEFLEKSLDCFSIEILF